MAKKTKFFKLTNALTNKPIYLNTENLFVSSVEELVPYVDPGLNYAGSGTSININATLHNPSGYPYVLTPPPPRAQCMVETTGKIYYFTEHISIVLAVLEGNDAKAAKLLFEKESNDKDYSTT